jgi:transcriptional regulator with XRE-family HTH domain
VAYGERLRELRAERRLSLRQVVERGGPNKDTMSLIERGVHRPHPQTLGRIAHALDMSVAELRGELEAAEHPLAEAPPSPEQPPLNGFNGLEEERHYEKYEDVLKALGFGQEQIEAWRAQEARDKEFSERELELERRRIEKLSPKELREELMARSLAEKRLHRYFADQQAEYTERRAQEPEAG